MSRGDFDGSGREEGLKREVSNMDRELDTGIQNYARAVGGASIAFTKEAHPSMRTATHSRRRRTASR
jgi:hypothetical protein